MHKLRDRMEKCECNESDPVVRLLHAHVPVTFTPPHDEIPGIQEFEVETLRGVVLGMTDLVTEAIREAPEDLKDIRKAKRAAKRGRTVQWPTTPQEILPGSDVEASMTMLCRWLDEFPSLTMIHLLQAVGFACGRKAIISLLLSATLPKNLVNILSLSLLRIPEHITRTNVRRLAMPISACFKLIATLETQPDGVPVAYFYDEHCDRLLEVLTEVAKLSDRLIEAGLDSRLPEASLPLWKRIVRFTGGSIHSKLELPADETKYHPSLLKGSELIRKKRQRDESPWQSASDHLIGLESLTRCAFPMCNENFASSGRKFKYCGRCKRVPYCSVECQRNDVRANEGPLSCHSC